MRSTALLFVSVMMGLRTVKSGDKILPGRYIVASHESQPRVSLCRNDIIRVSKQKTVDLCFSIDSPVRQAQSKSFDCEGIPFNDAPDGSEGKYVFDQSTTECFEKVRMHGREIGIFIPRDIQFTYYLETDPAGIASRRGILSVFLRWFEGEDGMMRAAQESPHGFTTKDFEDVSAPALVVLTSVIILTVL